LGLQDFLKSVYEELILTNLFHSGTPELEFQCVFWIDFGAYAVWIVVIEIEFVFIAFGGLYKPAFSSDGEGDWWARSGDD
jgi:hypothetical protein